jgi:hypothetical protein
MLCYVCDCSKAAVCCILWGEVNMNVQGAVDVRQTEIYTAAPLVPELNLIEF